MMHREGSLLVIDRILGEVEGAGIPWQDKIIANDPPFGPYNLEPLAETDAVEAAIEGRYSIIREPEDG